MESFSRINYAALLQYWFEYIFLLEFCSCFYWFSDHSFCYYSDSVYSSSSLLCHVLPLQEKGNEYVKMGKKHYSDAIDCYTRAINQKVLSDSENSVLFANRAHVNLLLGNYRHALTDTQEAIKLCPTNTKVYTFILVLLAHCCLILPRKIVCSLAFSFAFLL